jgi:hypothetical protein
MLPALLGLIMVLAMGLVMALPTQQKGCLAEFIRPLALIVGSVAPVALMWEKPTSALGVVAIVMAVILGASAVTLAATGLQALLRRGGVVEEDVVSPLLGGLGSFVSMGLGQGSAPSQSLGCGDVIFAVALVVLGALFILGLWLTNLLTRFAMPGTRTALRRAGRVLLSLAYALAVFAILVLLLSAI